MFERVIDRRIVRIVIGAAVGLPITAFALVGAIYGIFLGYGGIRGGDPLLLGLGAVTVLGLLGISGAWRRLLKPHEEMSHRERIVVRCFLFAGILASAVLAVWAAVSAESVPLALFFMALVSVGVLLALATPTAL